MARGNTFPPAARLHSAADFASLRGCRKPLRGNYFVIRHVPGRQALARLGMAVSRKTSKRATVRNRIKRTIRESFRQHRSRLPIVDLLVIARGAAAEADNAQLRQELELHWQRLQQICRPPTKAPAPQPRPAHPPTAKGNPT